MTVTEVLPDDATLRVARRQRVLAAMQTENIDLLVIGRESNARYVSGVRRLWTAGSRAFGPGCVLIREGGAVHLLSTWDEGVPDDIPRENLYGISFNAASFLKVLSNLEGAATARTVATDALTPSGSRMLGAAFPKATIVDGEQMLRRARSLKLPAEVDEIRRSVELAEHALATTIARLHTGITERQLTGTFMQAMASRGVTTPATQDVAWITSRDHPWRRESRDVPVALGDLIAFDAGVISNGYFGELGRTIYVGDLADNVAVSQLMDQRAALMAHLTSACRVGAPASDLLDVYEEAGLPQPPMPVARGLGLGFDIPLVTHALPRTARQQLLEPGMVFALSAYVWREGVGAAYLQEPVHMTSSGPQSLSSRIVPEWFDRSHQTFAPEEASL